MRRFEPALIALALGLAVVVLGGVRDTVDVSADPAPTPVVAPAPAVEVVEGPAAVPEVAELPPGVTAVLAAEGHTGFVDRGSLEGSVPPSVVAVLIDRGVVLRIPEDRP